MPEAPIDNLFPKNDPEFDYLCIIEDSAEEIVKLWAMADLSDTRRNAMKELKELRDKLGPVTFRIAQKRASELKKEYAEDTCSR